MVVDSHCHLADEKFTQDLTDVARRAEAAGVGAALCILAADDAEELGLHPGDDAQWHLKDTVYRLPVRVRLDLRRGVAGLPAGLPNMTGIVLPAWGKIARVVQ